jgi:hypothetical protein
MTWFAIDLLSVASAYHSITCRTVREYKGQEGEVNSTKVHVINDEISRRIVSG